MFDFRSFVKLRDYYEKLRGQSDKSLWFCCISRLTLRKLL